ncbi:MAG: DUF1444 family protein [Kofleriaceae bacterium]|nr:DUF1444 family protein [Kofleriaceae bacterium]MCB9574774.1 DUF1444 family protein [Kofleriaceae bacterium]
MWKRIRRLFGGSPEDAFADEVLGIVRAVPEVTGAERDGDEFVIVYKIGERGGRIALHNLFHEMHELDAGERRKRLRLLIGAMMTTTEAPRDWESVREALRPVLRSMSFVGNPDMSSMSPVWRGFSPFLAELVVIDAPTTMSYVTRADLDRWGISPVEALRAARGNLPIETAMIRAQTGGDEDDATWMVHSQDSYESSRLLLPGWLASFGDKVGGTPVAIVPHRGMLWVTSAESHAHVQILIDAAAKEFDDSPRAISPALYTIDGDGGVVPFEVERTHPLVDKIRAGHLRLADHEYGVQQQRLEAELERDGVDLFVASFRVLESEGGPRHSFCVWGHQVPSLLPEADLVAVFDDDAENPVFVPWDVVRGKVGAMWQPWDAAPSRVRTEGYPAGPQLSELRARAVFLDGN